MVITGGEPTLHPGLLLFLQKIKELGLKVKLDTNGTSPDVLFEAINQNLVDYVAMDIKTNLSNYVFVGASDSDIQNVLTSIVIIKSIAKDYEFRTTCIKKIIELDKFEEVGQLIDGSKRYYLQPCSRSGNMLIPEFFEQDDMYFTDSEMIELRDKVKPYVEYCEIRG